ncbi:hypothetical protein OTK55_03545 [Methanosphaera sp. Vir-13MRS]|uniref:hypothetical protein n=1 Tax=Candidatus Methanosphaera massiliense TaxID=3017187 RepID=UPI00238014F9|nr:hypothetical protein [Candidatus Methanosphaera massiliense]MDD6285776.1 hypothetical protein [Methanobacteriaceae archaeon]MDE4078093.1 hypothetical protein [Candidatus Methanosphaera massiliense]MDY2744513.1 hypothetical protein [Methanosphaera sp.]
MEINLDSLNGDLDLDVNSNCKKLSFNLLDEGKLRYVFRSCSKITPFGYIIIPRYIFDFAKYYDVINDLYAIKKDSTTWYITNNTKENNKINIIDENEDQYYIGINKDLIEKYKKKHEEEYKRSRMPFHEEQVSYKLQVSTDKLSHETIYTLEVYLKERE